MGSFAIQRSAATPDACEQPNGEIVEIVRARLHATLELVQAAKTMPWTDQLAIFREDNSFRYDKDVLPADEDFALWVAFNVEMEPALWRDERRQGAGPRRLTAPLDFARSHPRFSIMCGRYASFFQRRPCPAVRHGEPAAEPRVHMEYGAD